MSQCQSMEALCNGGGAMRGHCVTVVGVGSVWGLES